MKMPTIVEVAQALERCRNSYLPDCEDGSLDVRLQVYPDGDWAVRWGSADYDTDHRGYWGASSIDDETRLLDVAHDLICQAAEHAADQETT